MDRPSDRKEFLALLERCKAQVEADPSSYQNNPHLYDLLHRIYLRLCNGNIPFAEQMREEAQVFERRGLKDLAAMVRSYADDVDAHEENYENELLTLDEAAAESGYHKDSLSRMISERKTPNAGRRGAPRIRRRDLPRKPRSAPISHSATAGPQLVQAALTEQGILTNEV